MNNNRIWLWLYFGRIGSALSQLLNTVVFLSDRPNESISGRAFRLSYDGTSRRWRHMQVTLDWIYSRFGEDEHCYKAYINDIVEARLLLSEYEKNYKGIVDVGKYRRV